MGSEPRLIIVSASLRMGGAEVVALEQAERFGESCDVVFVTLDNDETDFFEPPVSVDRRSIDGPGAPARFGPVGRIWRLRKFLAAQRADAIIAHQDWVAILVILATRLSRRTPPIVVVEHLDPEFSPTSRYLRLLRRVTYRSAKVVCVLTDQAAEWLGPRCRTAVDVIPNPVPQMESTPSTERDIDVLCVGRQQPQKRYDRLIEAVGVLRDRGHELRVALAGDGAEREALLALVEKLGLESQVELLGRRSDVAQLYARSKVFALTSEREGHPLALLEAMSRGCVPVALDCRTGPREIIRPDVDGVLLRRDASAAEIARGIETVLSDDDRRSQMSLAAVEGMERFSTEAVDSRWKRLLAGVL